MRDIRFSEDDQARIRELRYHHPDPRALKRLEILTLFIHGEKHERIACLAGCSRSTVGRVLTSYTEHGLEETLRFHEVGPECELLGHCDSLETDLTNHPPRTIAEAQDRIEKLTGIRRGPTQVRVFLRGTLGMRWRKTRSISVPPKKSVAEQVAIQREFVEEKLNPRLDEARQGKRTVLFGDASHMVLNLIERLWKFVKKQALNNQHHTSFKTFSGESITVWIKSQRRTTRL